MDHDIQATPWDRKAFGFDTYEIVNPTEAVLQKAMRMKGHFTVKIDPLANKEPLYRHGFYYCDTLIEPYCPKERFRTYPDPRVSLSKTVPDVEALKAISDEAFVYGRYHRDFNIDPQAADRRYANWLSQMVQDDCVFTLFYDGELAGFFGYGGNRILLYTHKPEFRGKGLAKAFWSAACEELFSRGYDELLSSISAANMPILNLHATMGFVFRKPREVYHKLNRGE